VSARDSVDLASDPQSIVGSRVLDAPPELVFDAWSDPKHLSQWWGPNGFTTTTMSFDMRAGGTWRFVMRGRDGRDYQNRITYEEVVRPERLVYRIGGDADPMAFKVEVALEDLSGKTRLTMRGRFPSAAARARAIAEYGADKGLMQTLSRLEQYVLMLTGKEPVFSTTRTFNAQRDLVWAAWTDAKHLMHWWGPKGFTVVKCNIDLREGGLFHYGVKAPDGKIRWGKWMFREIAKPARLTGVVCFSDEDGGETRHPTSPTWPLTMLSTMTLEEEGQSTKVTIRRWPLEPTDEERKTFAAGMESMAHGWDETMDQLADYLAKIQ
jgi:uncharacterized protein YndB with AHSA1/START domain